MEILKEKIFEALLFFFTFIVLVIFAGLVLTLVVWSIPALKHSGLYFFAGSTWDPNKEVFGSLPFLVGTILTSFLALFFSLPFSFSIGIFLGEYLRGGSIYSFLKGAIELIAGIPSVVLGFWGLKVLAPLVARLQIALGYPPYGVSIFTASLILTLMILPFSTSVIVEVISMVPLELKEAAIALGATKYEVIKYISLPYTFSGVFAGVLMALGRALGETMAVTMVIGNSSKLPKSLLSPANTIASVIANEFAEAHSSIYLSSLIALAFLLFILTTSINILGKLIIKRFVVSHA